MENIGEYRGSKFAPQKYELYAPHYPPEFINKERTLSLVDVASTEFVAWYSAWHETTKDLFWRNSDTIMKITNSFDQLNVSRCRPRIKNLMDQAPVLDNRAPVKSM